LIVCRSLWSPSPALNWSERFRLRHDDLDIRPELNPWLGALFVSPQWRGRVVGSSLMRRAAEEAARLKIPRLFLWTSSAEGLYLKLNWEAIERTGYCGQRIVIMQKNTEESRSRQLENTR
jgi:GNAT superfamily N-acetyltransferase